VVDQAPPTPRPYAHIRNIVVDQSLPFSLWSLSNMASNMEVFIDGQNCIKFKVVNPDGLDLIDENKNVVFVSESGNLLLVYG